MMKNTFKNYKKQNVFTGILLLLVFAQALFLAKLLSERETKKYEVNLMPISTTKDSVDYAKMSQNLQQLQTTTKQIHSFLAEKGIADSGIDALAQDSLKSAVYLSKQTARYSQYLVDLQNKLQNVPLGMPTNGYISSNFGTRKNPIPVKAKAVAQKTATPATEQKIIEEKDSLGNVTKRVVQISKTPSTTPKETNNAPAEADQMQFHKGLDIAVEYGSDVRCTAAGTVIFAGQKGGYGNCIIISHGNGLDTLYGHLSQILVATNDLVKVGQVIAKSGNTGRSTGPHLHYEVHKDGSAVNPKLFLNF